MYNVKNIRCNHKLKLELTPQIILIINLTMKLISIVKHCKEFIVKIKFITAIQIREISVQFI